MRRKDHRAGRVGEPTRHHEGQAPDAIKDPESGAEVPSVLLQPKAITFDNVNDVVADGYIAKDELCAGAFAAKCTESGVQ